MFAKTTFVACKNENTASGSASEQRSKTLYKARAKQDLFLLSEEILALSCPVTVTVNQNES